jgi:hypothetical protein
LPISTEEVGVDVSVGDLASNKLTTAEAGIEAEIRRARETI